MIEQVLIFTLGVCVAALVMSVLLPAYGARGRRLARRELELEMPMSISEIAAERDQLRAEFATQQRRLEQRLEVMSAQNAERMQTISRQTQQIEALNKDLAAARAGGFGVEEAGLAPTPAPPSLSQEEAALLRRAIREIGQDVVRLMGSPTPISTPPSSPPSSPPSTSAAIQPTQKTMSEHPLDQRV